MANSTVRGNKTTKELKKGVSIMKKSCFKILCMVLIIALLAPNVFAATPAPEAPLADAATVARVKQEIATGEITDMEDLFLVAYQHLGADLEEEGMTAYINEDGTLGIKSIINSKEHRTRGGFMVEEELAVTSVLLISDDVTAVNLNTEIISRPISKYGGLDNVMVYAMHTAHYSHKYTYDADDEYLNIDDEWLKLNSVVTTLTYGSNAFSASKLVQTYHGKQNDFSADHIDSLTTNSPAAITHSFPVSGTQYYDLHDANAVAGFIRTESVVYIANSNQHFTITVVENLFGE